MRKVPYNPQTRKGASSSDPDTWSDYETAAAAMKTGLYDGLGFEFGNSPFFGVDLDDVVSYEKGGRYITAEGHYVVETMNSYTELSPSRSGVHIIARGSIPEGRRRALVRGHSFEMYENNQFFTVTGNIVGNVAPQERTKEAAELHRKYWLKPHDEVVPPVVLPKSVGTVRAAWLEYIRYLSDYDLLDAIFKSGLGQKVHDLFNGNCSDENGGQNGCDQALITYLIGFTGDAQRADTLFRMSALYRDKWERKDYRDHTIEWAVKNAYPFVGYIENYKTYIQEYERNNNAD